ncbi:MAG: endonuclease/exonuclease/phosphatase family protein [Bacteroidales bacterium]|nr:endonuclease/exonuclease/phosphatase family protein [Bacteroidales bacterium]
MAQWFKIMLWSLVSFIILIMIILIIFLTHAHVNDFNPEQSELITAPSDSVEYLSEKQYFTILSWNIGYAGLGSDMDFFYDGGDRVRPELEEFKKYSKNIYRQISSFNAMDIILLQEVDIHSRRSFYNNEAMHICEILPQYHSFFAVNYKVPFVPLPIFNPLGQVHSGIQTLSKAKPIIAEKRYYPSSYSWPYKLFMLDRAYLKTVYKLHGRNNLIVYNTHNSAFDDGELRNIEFRTIKNDMLNEYLRGNYVVAGGDWNQNPPTYTPGDDPENYNLSIIEPRLDQDAFPANWKWAYEKKKPTNRSNDKPYVKGENSTTIIDYFLVSPNMNIDTVITQGLGFENSDHNPVFLKISIPETASDTLNLISE